MADTAARLVDHVLPHVPVRQWVLTMPFELRYRMAYDPTDPTTRRPIPNEDPTRRP